MKARYLTLLVAIVVCAIALGVWSRSAAVRTPPKVVSAAAPMPTRTLTLRVGPEGLVPSLVRVAKGERVALAITNEGKTTVAIDLLGYEDRVPSMRLGPGETGRGGFLADRPGDEFAWMVDGKPAGRLTVTGPHLIEGHR